MRYTLKIVGIKTQSFFIDNIVIPIKAHPNIAITINQ